MLFTKSCAEYYFAMKQYAIFNENVEINENVESDRRVSGYDRMVAGVNNVTIFKPVG